MLCIFELFVVFCVFVLDLLFVLEFVVLGWCFDVFVVWFDFVGMVDLGYLMFEQCVVVVDVDVVDLIGGIVVDVDLFGVCIVLFWMWDVGVC